MDNGGPAFPRIEMLEDHGNGNTGVAGQEGMTLRDYFATKAASDDIAAITYQHLSITAQEEISGMKYPREPEEKNSVKTASFHIQRAEFHMAVTARLRFMFADAMLAARKVKGSEVGE